MNEKIIANLKLLAEKEKSHPYKHRAYLKGIQSLQSYPDQINTPKDVEHLPGIGKGILEKIEKILDETFIAPNEEEEILTMFKNIYGIGDKKANELFYKNNITDLTTLQLHQDKFLNEKQKIGLKYYYPLLERISFTEMQLHHKFIYNIWKNDTHSNPYKFTFEMVGSYRRQSSTSGDIDILITFEESLNLLPRLIFTLRRNNYIIETLAEGPKKFMGICRLPQHTPRRIDIIWTSREEYPFALLYFTGSDNYNRYVREHANKLGYRLNERQLLPITEQTKNKQLPHFETEKDIIEFLGLSYKEPKERI